jgi:hypothetical protein
MVGPLACGVVWYVCVSLSDERLRSQGLTVCGEL